MKAIYKYTLRNFTILAIFYLTVFQVEARQLAILPQERATMLQYLIETQPVLGELIAKSGLAPTLSGDAVYTFLVPSEADLSALKNEQPQRIRAILSGHILKGRYMESDLKDGANIETLAGTKVTVCRKKDHTLVSGSRIMAANTEVKNGVIHQLSSSIKL